jgi:glycosyltransferase involved in cell wall biosynthesis
VGAATKTNAEFNVLFYGNYIPLHGIETIVRAAKLLESHQHIVWTLIGTGQQRPFIDRLTEELQVRSIRFVDWVPYSDIPAYIARADVCLGIFGATEKAARVVPNKAYQALPAHRPLITGDTPAARAALLRDGIEGAWLVPVGDANSLAQAVLELSQSPQKCATLAQGGVELYRRYYSSEIIGKQVAGIFTELV